MTGLLSKVRSKLTGRHESTVVVSKPSARADDLAQRLRQGIKLDPPIERAVEAVSARMRQVTDSHESSRYASVADHFAGASSGPRKLALLQTLVRHAQAKRILEIGTAYGLSGIALGMSQAEPDLVTLERGEPQATLGPANIRTAVHTGVEAIAGDKDEILPRLVSEGRNFDFVFHDGGHDGDGYVRDFDLLEPIVTSGGLYLIDDISWDKKPHLREITGKRSRRTCLEGWGEVLTRSRVNGAVTFGDVGILLLN